MSSKKINRAEFLEMLLPSLFLSFTFFLFGPVELYISNITEFWFSFGDVLWPSMLVGIFSCGILLLVGSLLRGRWREYYFCLLMGIAIALYVQGNFVKIDYGVLDGRAIPWENYTSVAIWNTLLWIACIVLPFIGRLSFRKQYKTGIAMVAGCVLLVQMITLGTLLATTDFKKNEDNNFYLSTKNLFTVSKNKNIVIFVLDTFEQRYLDEIFLEAPEMMDLFDGFTSYSNTTCAYPTTKGAMPFILTGQYYKNEQPYREYIKEAYQNTYYYNELKESGFDIGLYTDDQFVSAEAKKIFLANAEDGGIQVKSPIELEKAMLQFISFRYFPHIAKKYVWFSSGIFDELKNQKKDGNAPYIAYDNNRSFYLELVKNQLSFLSDNSNAYRLIHLWGTHAPATLNSDITVSEDKDATYISQGKACLNIISEYLEQLKRMNIYDQTMVIVTADHGSSWGTFPIFMIKGFGEHGIFQISESPISHSDLIPIVSNSINPGQAHTDDIDYKIGRNNTKRNYYWYQWDNSWDKDYLPDIIEYEVNDQKELYQTGNRYTSLGLETFSPYAYELGTEIISIDSDPHQYFQSGLSNMEGNEEYYWVWTWGKSGQILLNIEGASDNLIGEFIFSNIYAPPQRLLIRSGEKILYDSEIVSREEIVNFHIPSECIKNGWLTLDLEYPDAVSPKSRREGEDTRELAFAFERIRFYQSEK